MTPPGTTANRRTEGDSDRLAAVVACSTDAILGLGLDGTLERWNDGAERLFGRSWAELAGQRVSFLRADVIARLSAGEHAAPYRTVCRRRDGTRMHVCVAVSSVVDASGAPTGLIAIVRDMRNHHRLLQQMLQRRKLGAIAGLAGAIAHEFNNQLMAILGSAQLALAELPNSSPIADDVRDVIAAADVARGSIASLLAFSTRRRSRPETIDVAAVLQRIGRLAHSILPGNVELEVQVATTSSVLAPPGDLEQIVFGLIMSACDAMPDGGKIAIVANDVHGQERSVRIRIDDTGAGTRDRAVEPLLTTRPLNERGGLGLWNVHRSLHRAHGRLATEHRVDGGTSVRIALPAAPPPALPRNARAATGDSSDATILLVEDEQPVRRVSARILSRFGYEVIEAVDGEDALRVAARHPGRIDLVISDVVMPGMGGRALAAELRRRYPGCRVLLISGYAGAAPLAPDQSFLRKPFTPDALATAVRDALADRP